MTSIGKYNTSMLLYISLLILYMRFRDSYKIELEKMFSEYYLSL